MTAGMSQSAPSLGFYQLIVSDFDFILESSHCLFMTILFLSLANNASSDPTSRECRRSISHSYPDEESESDAQDPRVEQLTRFGI